MSFFVVELLLLLPLLFCFFYLFSYTFSHIGLKTMLHSFVVVTHGRFTKQKRHLHNYIEIRLQNIALFVRFFPFSHSLSLSLSTVASAAVVSGRYIEIHWIGISFGLANRQTKGTKSFSTEFIVVYIDFCNG